MTAITKILAGGVGLAALAGAAPAAAQYYPQQSPYGYGQGGGLGAIIESLLGGNRYARGFDQRPLVERCIAAVNHRIERRYAGNRYGAPYGSPYGQAYGGYGSPYGQAYGGYGYNQSSARVVGITNVDQRRSNLRVRGIATTGAYAAAPYGAPYGSPYGAPYGQAYGYQAPQGELSFACTVDFRGRIRDIDINQNRNAYRYGYPYRR